MLAPLNPGSQARGTEKYPPPRSDGRRPPLLLLYSAATNYDLRYADGSRRVPRLSIINDKGNRYSLGSYLDSAGRESYGFGQEVPVLGRTREDETVVREAGWVSPLHVNRVFSFNNEVVVVDMTAKDLVN